MRSAPLGFFWLCLALLVVGCWGSDKVEGEFTEEELAWLVYDKGDKLNFTTPDGQQHQFKVTERTDLEQIKNYFPIEAEVVITDTVVGEDFRIYLLKDEKSFRPYFRVGEVYRPLDLLKPLGEMTIGNRAYKDVYRIMEDTTINQKIDIWQVDFNKEYGVLRYWDRQDGVYSLVN